MNILDALNWRKANETSDVLFEVMKKDSSRFELFYHHYASKKIELNGV